MKTPYFIKGLGCFSGAIRRNFDRLAPAPGLGESGMFRISRTKLPNIMAQKAAICLTHGKCGTTFRPSLRNKRKKGWRESTSQSLPAAVRSGIGMPSGERFICSIVL